MGKAQDRQKRFAQDNVDPVRRTGETEHLQREGVKPLAPAGMGKRGLAGGYAAQHDTVAACCFIHGEHLTKRYSREGTIITGE